MTGPASNDLSSRLISRLRAAGLAANPSIIAQSAGYLRLLQRWNARMNLTALPLSEPMPDATLDKLVVEPLAAVDLFPSGDPVWFDLGSGGGSPAIPLRLARPGGSLTMVEARQRKCAFLREAVRSLGLARAAVLALRFEQFKPAAPADVVTVRAVRIDEEMADQLARFVRPGGSVFCFGGSVADPRFAPVTQRALADGSTLSVLRRA